jgi:predicted O-methyltransferase YrrM
MKVDAAQLFRSIGSRGRSEFKNFTSKGLYEAGRLVTDRAVQRLCVNYFRTAMRPSLHQLAGAAESVHMSAVDMVRIAFPEISDSRLGIIEEEYLELRAELALRCATMGDRLAYPEWYAIERETSFLLYVVCRLLAPGRVLETGVANGHSSFFFLQAMIKNGGGRLHSVDISANAGQLLTEDEKENWSLYVLTAPQRRSFASIVDAVSPVDIFFHDSDHTYGWQKFEYRVAQKSLNPQGIFLSDDVDHSLAFLEFCQARARKPILLIDTRKVFGLVLPSA